MEKKETCETCELIDECKNEGWYDSCLPDMTNYRRKRTALDTDSVKLGNCDFDVETKHSAFDCEMNDNIMTIAQEAVDASDEDISLEDYECYATVEMENEEIQLVVHCENEDEDTEIEIPLTPIEQTKLFCQMIDRVFNPLKED